MKYFKTLIPWNTGLFCFLIIVLVTTASCTKKDTATHQSSTPTPKTEIQPTESQQNESQGQEQSANQQPPDTQFQEPRELTPTERAIVKYYVQLDYSIDNPGFILPPTEVKRMLNKPVTEDDRKKDREYFDRIESVTKLWMQRNLLKTAANFNKDPGIIQDAVSRAVRLGEFASFVPTENREEELKQENLKKFPEGRSITELEKLLSQEVELLQSKQTPDAKNGNK